MSYLMMLTGVGEPWSDTVCRKSSQPREKEHENWVIIRLDLPASDSSLLIIQGVAKLPVTTKAIDR